MTQDKCKIKTKLFDKLLSQDTINPTAEDLEHITNCIECDSAWSRTGKLEILLKKEKARIMSDIPAVNTKTILNSSKNDQGKSFGFINIFNLNNLLSFSFVLILIVIGISRFYSPCEQNYVDIQEKFVIASGQIMSGNKLFNSATEPHNISGKPFIVNKTATVMLQNKIAIAFSEAEGNLENTKLELNYGKVLVWVKKKGTKFSVQTPTSTFKVVGTKFFIHHKKDNDTTLEVVSGKVQVTTISNKVISASKGSIVSIDTKGKIVFYKETLPQKMSYPAVQTSLPKNVQSTSEKLLSINHGSNSNSLVHQATQTSEYSNSSNAEDIYNAGEEATIDQTEKNSFLDSIMATERD